MADNTPKVWFIREASSGPGRSLVHHALESNNKVIATARVLEQIEDMRILADSSRLYLLQLDITDPSEVVSKKIYEALSVWGSIDVIVNDPETGLKMIEDTSASKNTDASHQIPLSSEVDHRVASNIPASAHILRRNLPSSPSEKPSPPDLMSFPSVY